MHPNLKILNRENLIWLENKTIAFLGDSVTSDLNSNYVTLTLDRIADVVDVSKIKIVNSGVDSSSILDALDRLPELLEEHDPDIFIVFVGINDSKIFQRIDQPLIEVNVFEDSYCKLISRMDADKQREKILLTPPPLLLDEIANGDLLADYWYWTSESYLKYIEAIRNVAKKYSCAIADVYEAFQRRSEHRLFYEDGVHPNLYGHRLIAAEVVTALVGLS